MGLRDVAEQLDACKLDAIQMEAALARIRRIAETQLRLEQPSIAVARQWAEVERNAREAVEWRP